ncbi:MAG TPA: type II secretion system F family protein [Sedimentisphaerales bacterium]|nr:type II secretion system F family protein [Sedimentisphaerales bacterium]
MAVYAYTAKDETGDTLTGTYDDIDNAGVLREELSKMGYVLIKARKRRNPTRRRRRIKQSEVVTFIYKFAEMYSAGLSITRCLEVLEEQIKNPAFGYIVADVRQSIENGSSLEKAFGKYSDVFSDFFSGMLEAGESGGKLSEALEMSAEYLEKRLDIKRKIRSAFAYPVIVTVVCFVVVGCLVAFIVPVFSKLYRRLNVELPGPTQALVNLSSLLTNFWWAIPFIVVGAAIILLKLSRSPYVKAKWDVFKLNMPVLGKLNRMVVISHFTRTFGMLTSVGVSPIRALEVASAVAHNHKLTGIAKELQRAIETGNSIGKSLKNYDIFPPMITQMAISGEEVGEVAQMLNKGADFLDKDIDRTMSALIVKLEPALTIIMGVIVGFILMAVYLPMFDYMQYLE